MLPNDVLYSLHNVHTIKFNASFSHCWTDNNWQTFVDSSLCEQFILFYLIFYLFVALMCTVSVCGYSATNKRH